MAKSLILNIPHSSSFIPSEDVSSAFLPHIGSSRFIDALRHPERNPASQKRDELIRQELLVMTDWYTDELFNHCLGMAVITPVSRLVCDTERFSHDSLEPMAREGMGYCYTNGSQCQVIKQFNDEYKDEILWRYYAPHHIALTDAVGDSLLSSGSALILDCHSFSSKPLPYEKIQNNDRPDICIGTDTFHTPKSLSSLVQKFFSTRGYKVSFNTPYSGTMVPIHYYHKDGKVHSVMIEINRSLYLDEASAEKNSEFKNILSDIFDLEMLLTLSKIQ